MLEIKILGSGCMNCKRLEEIVTKTAKELQIEISIEKITDYVKIAEYNVLATPGLVINGKVMSSGKIPSKAQIVSWIQDKSTN